jgi:site-specific recombinase XerD
VTTSTYVRRLGLPQFAHLRAVVEGLRAEDAARRYLPVDTLAAARTEHAPLLQHLTALVRRRGDPRWRLLRLAGRIGQPAASTVRPTLQQWADAKGVDIEDWGERELLEIYEADCAVNFPLDPREQRRALRALRLRERQLQLLRELEPIAAEPAQGSDLIEGWFDPLTAERLKRSGLLRLDELQRRIARGGRWYAHVPAIGAGKAKRIANYLALLLPAPPDKERAVAFYASLLAPAAAVACGVPATARALLPAELDGSAGSNRAPVASAGVQASHDLEAIEAWLRAKAGAPGQEGFVAATARRYRTEAERLLLWCMAERGKPLSSMTAEDCAAYKAFLAEIPDAWMSRRRAARHTPGWTPFATQLTLASQQHALTVVGSLFRWLVAARYLVANPWELVKTRLGDDPRQTQLDSRAFTPRAWSAILEWVQAQPRTPAQARTEFLLDFEEGVGLRADELVTAELGQFRRIDDARAGDSADSGWVMAVHGKGARNRLASVPPQAVRALNRYLAYRKLPPLGEAAANVPLVARVDDPLAPITYQSLYESLRSWLRRAIVASTLSPAEKDLALRASPHWLRHTCGTRALERGVPLRDLQGQFGHADPRTTMRYAKTQLQERQGAFGKAFS